jgi:hypothetical protein
MILRPAAADDVGGMMAVKRELRIGADAAGTAPAGGFLLGASAEQYAFFVEHARVLVLEGGAGEIGGFAVALPDAVVRASDLWARRRSIAWAGGGWDAVEDERVGYFDQLAVRPSRRFRAYAPALALAALDGLAASGHRHVFATTVREPFVNTASLPLLRAAGARRVGEIEETYPEVGRILSDVHHLPVSPDTVRTLADATPLGRRVMRMLRELRGGAVA